MLSDELLDKILGLIESELKGDSDYLGMTGINYPKGIYLGISDSEYKSEKLYWKLYWIKYFLTGCMIQANKCRNKQYKS